MRKGDPIFTRLRRLFGFTSDATADLPPQSLSSVREGLNACRSAFAAAGVFSLVLSFLMLTGSLYMLEVYDRVVPGHSVPTLVAITILVVILYSIQSVLESTRSRLFARIGRRFDHSLRDAVFLAHARSGLPSSTTHGVPVWRDLDQVRSFLASPAPSTLFDLPLSPLFLILLFLLHPYIGTLGLFGILCLISITWLNELASKPIQSEATQRSVEASQQIEMVRHAAETIFPLGMAKSLRARWQVKHEAAGVAVLASSDLATFYGGWSRFLRMSLQSLMLGLGAFLVIHGEASGGVMIASSILLGRALAPVEMATTHWRSFVAARQAYRRLEAALPQLPRDPTTQLPHPNQTLQVEGLYVAAPGVERKLILSNINFALEAGDALGIIGPSGSGKSTLARALVGVSPIVQGHVRFDGAELNQWRESDVGSFLGYLPQEVELFAGTFSENIARFQDDAPSEAILDAAQRAGLETFIRGFEQGFDTDIGPRGARLSVGQRQRVGLARALYGGPFVVVLDEPNSALDAHGELALLQAINNCRKRGAIVIMIAHRPKMLQAVNKVLVLSDGQQKAFGLRDEVLKRSNPDNRPAAASSGLSVIRGRDHEG